MSRYVSAVRYTLDSTEMQLRRLADLAFMFQMYELAYSVYYLLKKDFEGDKAWMYCAGTQVSLALIDASNAGKCSTT